MGFGHQRAAHALAYLAEGGVIVAGSAAFTDPDEMDFWARLNWSYNVLSRTRSVPVIGRPLFGLLDAVLRIPPFYPLRDLSHASPNNWILDHLIRGGLGRSLLAHLKQRRLPLISTFYAPSLAADGAYDGPVYSVICDADLNRVWVASKPSRSRIQYFAPCGQAMLRLRQYGVPDERIFITGFPLPRENIGGPGKETLKSDLLARLGRLDPLGRFSQVFGSTVQRLLGAAPIGAKSRVTVTFSIGGAGAQTEIGMALARGLAPGIRDGRFRLVLVAGVHPAIERRFREFVERVGLSPELGDGLMIVREETKPVYFDRFNALMRETDILWTKPSELSFYSGLGIPIVMAPALGSQEDRNRDWLLDKGCALPQEDPLLALEWLGGLLKDGVFAEKAFAGFVKNRTLGAYKVEEVLATGTMTRETHPLRR